MPSTPPNNTCGLLGCKRPKSKLNSYCLAHGGRDVGFSRDSDKSYKTAAWTSIRRRQLSLQPLCAACLSRGRVSAAQHVDHLFPWRSVGAHAFTHNIFQSLCQPCHSHKTAQEKQGNIEQYGAEGVKVWTINDYGYVLANHN